MVFHDIPLNCINEAALQFRVPAKLIIAIIKTENGKNGSARQNRNGTHDLGVMQINTTWLPFLQKKGISREQLQYDPCINVHVGAYILAKGIAKSEGWAGVGNYHSFTTKYNKIYRQKVQNIYQAISTNVIQEINI